MTVQSLPQPTWFQRLVQELRTEAGSRERQAAAVGLGLFIGCLPIWGFHLGVCILVGRLFHLNRLKMYLAANISNPVLLPLLVLGGVQIGRFTRNGDFYALSLAEVRHLDPWTFGWDLVAGSVILGIVIGLAGALLALVLTRSPRPVDGFLERAADRYLVAGVAPWEFARQKLTRDPVYFDVLRSNLLPATGRLLDLGCGQGLLLATLSTARSWQREGRWPPAWGTPPDLALHGVELRRRMVRIARRALDGEAVVVHGDARVALTSTWSAVAIFDVLHLLPRADQDALLAAVAGALEPGGVLLLREADADGSWGFRFVYLTNALKALIQGNWTRRFAFRRAGEWHDALEALGLCVSRQTAGDGTPFSNVLLIARKPAQPSH